MKNKAVTPTFRTPELLKWIFVGLLLLPIGMMTRNAYIMLQGENESLTGANGELTEEVAVLKEENFVLGKKVVGLEGDLAAARLENERLLVAKSELVEEINAVRVEIGYHETREDSLQRVIDLLKNEIVASERKVNDLRRENQIAAAAFRRMGGGEFADGGLGSTPEIAEKNYFELVKANEQLAKQAEANDRQALELLGEISELNTELEHFKATQEELKGKVVVLNQELLEKRAMIDAIAVRQAE